MSSVTFSPAVGGDGSTVTDDNNPTTGLAGGGHRTRFVPALSQVIGVANWVNGKANDAQTSANSAATSANSAANAPGTSAASTTSDTIATGPTTITIQTGKLFAVGQTVVIANTPTPTNRMVGTITAHDSVTGSLTVNVTKVEGTGTFTAWTVSLSGPEGLNGAKGEGSYEGYSARTANTVLGVADKGKLIDITSGTFTQTFAAAATLGAVWYCTIRNSATGDITLDPSGAELIDGLSSYVMYPGEVRLVTCDGATLTSVVLAPFIKAFTTSATFVKPPGYKAFEIELWGGGGGGGGGCAGSAANVKTGGAGGGGGGYNHLILSTSAIGTSEVLGIAAVAAGGAGASGVAAPGGVTGNSSTFGTLMTAYGGSAGVGGSVGTSTNTGGNGGVIPVATTSDTTVKGGSGGGSNASAVPDAFGSVASGGGGGGGGGESVSDVLAAKGGNGGKRAIVSGGGGIGGNSVASNPVPGANGADFCGGGGGGSAQTVNGAPGGAGGTASGGGGGGSSRSTFTGGNGGVGGPGYAVIRGL